MSFRCRFQLQLSSPTSLCKQHSGQRPWNGDVCGVARVSLRGCELHSLWAREFLPADSMWLRRLTPSFPFSSLLYLPSFLSLSLPSLLLPSLLFTISSFILFLSSLAFDSPFFPVFLSFPPQMSAHSGPEAPQSDQYTSMKKTVLFGCRNCSGEK